MIEEQKLLDLYKQYDYLNADEQQPLIKILVSYIKPSFLFKSNILTPIHLGRAIANENSKDGVISELDLKWLYENCIGDDDFKGNISYTNRRVGFLTGTYWAWKNYSLLGSPKYFGSCGYRKLFDVKCLENVCDYDAIIPVIEVNANDRTNKERYIYSRDVNMYNLTMKVMEKLHQKDIPLLEKYFDMRAGYYHEMYIFQKHIFFNFCEWIFPILFDLLKYNHEDFMPDQTKELNIVQQVQSTFDVRDVAFVIERLTGFYCFKLTQNNKIKIKETPYHIFRTKEDERKDKQKVIDIIRLRMKNSMEKK